MDNFLGVGGAGLPALQSMFATVLYGAIGLIGPSVILFTNLDAAHDRLKMSYFDNEDTFDFIVGKFLKLCQINLEKQKY